MLDNKTSAVLKTIGNMAGQNYTILQKEDIIANVKQFNLTPDGLNAILVYLKENDFVDVKYQDKEQICICTTLKADAYQTGISTEKQNVSVTKRQFGALFWIISAASFVGSLVAIIISKLFRIL